MPDSTSGTLPTSRTNDANGGSGYSAALRRNFTNGTMVGNKGSDIVRTISLCEQPAHRFKISLIVGSAIGLVFAVLDTINVAVLQWLDEWSGAAAQSISLLVQAAFIFAFLFACNFCLTVRVI